MLELKIIKAVAAIHRGTVNLSLRSLVVRDKLATKAYNAKLELAEDLERLAHNTVVKARATREAAREKRRESTKRINAANNVLLNARDDLNRFSNDA